MNALELTPDEIAHWTPKTQAIAKLMDAHFNVFNAMERTKLKRDRNKAQKALGTLYRAAEHLRQGPRNEADLTNSREGGAR